MSEQKKRPWLPRTRAEVGAPHEITLTTLATAYTDLHIALMLARRLDEPHPGDGAELAELALGAAIAQQVTIGRALGMREARLAGATWREVALALDVTEDDARDEFARWIDGQSSYYATNGKIGLDADQEAAARQLLEQKPV